MPISPYLKKPLRSMAEVAEAVERARLEDEKLHKAEPQRCKTEVEGDPAKEESRKRHFHPRRKAS